MVDTLKQTIFGLIFVIYTGVASVQGDGAYWPFYFDVSPNKSRTVATGLPPVTLEITIPTQEMTTMEEVETEEDLTSQVGKTLEEPRTPDSTLTVHIKTYLFCHNDTGTQQICEVRCHSENFSCENEGYCVMNNYNFPYCKCLGTPEKKYSGPRCEEIILPKDCFDQTFILVASATSIIILFLMVSNVVTFFWFKHKDKKRAASMHRFTYVRFPAKKGSGPPNGSNRLPSVVRENPYAEEPSSNPYFEDRKISTDTTYNAVVYLESSAYVSGDYSLQGEVREQQASIPPSLPRPRVTANYYEEPRQSTVYDMPRAGDDTSPSNMTSSSGMTTSSQTTSPSSERPESSVYSAPASNRRISKA